MENHQLDILELIINASVVVKLVIFLLLGFSVYTWAIVLRKYTILSKINNLNSRYLKKFKQVKNLDEAQTLVGDTNTLMGKILNSSFEELYQLEELRNASAKDSSFIQYKIKNIERSIENSIAECSFILRRSNSSLASISSIAPFVGLFGTVWGIINSFQGLAGGGGSVQAVAPGIAEALVATAIGLAAAIPANWFFNKFTTEASVVEESLERFGKDVINLIERNI